MNSRFRALLSVLIGGAFWLAPWMGWAAPDRGIVTGNRANLRASPTLNGDVVGSVAKGESLVVLEQIPVSNPQPDEPSSWARVRMPASARVWVYGAFVDPKSGKVTVRELKIRSGPGKNFTSVGDLKQGDLVVPIRTVDDWMQIDPPPSATAYLAGNVVEIASAGPGSAPTTAPAAGRRQIERSAPNQPVTSGNTVAVQPPPQAQALPPSRPTAPTPIVVAAATQPAAEPAPVEPPVVVSAPVSAPPPATPAVPVPTAPVGISASTTTPPVGITTTTTSRQPELVYDDTKPRRVLREGIVGTSLSPDAPTWYQLDSFRRREGVLNYLWVENVKETDLSKWRGKRVFVSGDEYRDRRWRTPVLKVISVQAAF